jgi:hypothetical protein
MCGTVCVLFKPQRYQVELHLKAFFLDFQPVDNQVAPNVALLKNTIIGLG